MAFFKRSNGHIDIICHSSKGGATAMAYDVGYVNELVSSYEKLVDTRGLDAFRERAWLLKLMAEHTKLIGEVPKEGLTPFQSTIMADFCTHFRANTGMKPVEDTKPALVLAAPKRVYSFGGVRDD